MDKILYWFRSDLRLSDNEALTAAARALANGQKLVPIACFGKSKIVSAADWWQSESIKSLQSQLNSLGSSLIISNDRAETALPAIAKEIGATAVYFTAAADPTMFDEDKLVIEALNASNINAQPVAGKGLAHDPGKLLKPDGTPYKVFTPFYKKQWLPTVDDTMCEPLPAPPKTTFAAQSDLAQIANSELPATPHWAKPLQAFWDEQAGGPGEDGAKARLIDFIDGGMAQYKTARDALDKAGTSNLSAALHWGELSPRQIIYAARMADTDNGESAPFIRQLAWRDFAAYTLHHHPHTATQSLKPEFDDAMWRTDDRIEEDYEKWCHGETGQDLVDAAMQELWQTGIMHNRTRMIVASYLTKNLGIDWRRGADWFMHTLVDADPANNALGWQWVAGCGTDAAPYFRIFNPETQAAKFDPKGHYRRRWLGPDWDFRNVPPLVDLKESRASALARYDAMRAD